MDFWYLGLLCQTKPQINVRISRIYHPLRHTQAQYTNASSFPIETTIKPNLFICYFGCQDRYEIELYTIVGIWGGGCVVKIKTCRTEFARTFTLIDDTAAINLRIRATFQPACAKQRRFRVPWFEMLLGLHSVDGRNPGAKWLSSITWAKARRRFVARVLMWCDAVDVWRINHGSVLGLEVKVSWRRRVVDGRARKSCRDLHVVSQNGEWRMAELWRKAVTKWIRQWFMVVHKSVGNGLFGRKFVFNVRHFICAVKRQKW